jgi:hypothetical protein
MRQEIKTTGKDFKGIEWEFPTTEEYSLTDIRKVQEILLIMADKVHAILKKHNIPYFITFGTLLGAVRHGGIFLGMTILIFFYLRILMKPH